MKISRREFLSAAAVLGLPPVPSFLLRASESAPARPEGRVLVVLQLSGGNDGLNTVIPFEDPAYLAARPTLAVRKGAALPLRDGPSPGSGPGPAEVGFHHRMQALHALYREGAVAVVQGVGYPNPSRSHFRSMDIWHTARPEVEGVEKGWLGEVLSRERRLGRLHAGGGLHVGEESLPLALHGEVQVPTLQNLDWLEELASSRGRELRSRLQLLHTRPRGGEAERVRSLASATLGDLERLLELRGRSSPASYPPGSLGQKLRWVAQLVSGGFGSRLYYLSQGGYDTHAQQKDAHGELLGQLSDSLGAFLKHLRAVGAAHRVTVLVFSEFGRRVRENGSLGTDHGCAAPVFVVGDSVRGGLHGAHPSMTSLEEGDLRFHTDFRRIYATLLEEVLEAPSEMVLGGKFEKLNILARRARV